jgi:prophage tail gpP-like protein
MPNEVIKLSIGGQVHADWTDFEVDSDYLTPADAWQVTLGPAANVLPAEVFPGQRCQLFLGNDLVMTGRIDEVRDAVSKGSRSFHLSGRDNAAVLIDCSAPVFVAKQVSLEDIVAKIVKPLGIDAVRLDAKAVGTRDKVNVEPGDSAWDALVHAAEANGLWAWCEPDGTLVVGGPDYDVPIAATLILRTSGKGNNVASFEQSKSVHKRFSNLTVLGQTHGTRTETGKHSLKAAVADADLGTSLALGGVYWTRPKIAIDHEADSEALCRDRARKLLADGRMASYTLTARVHGFRVDDGRPWAPGMRVQVVSEPHGINAPMFVMGRKFQGGREQSGMTTLTLKEDRAWVLDARPHKNKHRRGKNSLPAQVVDVAPLVRGNK